MKSLCLSLSVLFGAGLAALPIPAQPETFLVEESGGVMPVPYPGALVRFDTAGAVSSVMLPVGVDMHDARISPGGQNVIMVGIGGAGYALFEFAPGPGILRTLSTHPDLYGATKLTHGQDGDMLILASGGINGFSLVRWDGTAITRLTTVVTPNIPVYSTGIGRDPWTGLVVFRGQGGPGNKIHYYHIDATKHAITTLARETFLEVTNTTTLFTDDRGDFVDVLGEWPGPRSCLVRLDPRTGKTSTTTIASVRFAAVETAGGRAFPIRFRALEGSRLYSIRADGAVLSTQTLQRYVNVRVDNWMVRLGSLHLSWQRVNVPNDRILFLDFPGEGGQNFVAAASLTGSGAGPMLPDGRRVPITVDGLSAICLAGGIPGVLDNTVGALDAKGRARVRVFANRFGAVVRGLRIWFAAAVLDPSASSGIAHLAGPEILVL